MDYSFKIIYPNLIGNLAPTDDPTKFLGIRERNGAMQPIGVQISEQSSTVSGDVETVLLKITTTIINEFDPEI